MHPTPRRRRSPLTPPPTARLLLLSDAPDAAGEPRAALVLPGRRFPIAYPSVSAAVAALHALQRAQ